MTFDPQQSTGGAPAPVTAGGFGGGVPGGYPHAALGYQHPVEGRRAPAGAMVLSILGIVLAAIWLLIGAYGLLMSAGLLLMGSGPGLGPLNDVDGWMGVMAWQCGTAVVRGLLGVFLLVASIGCLRMARWGRVAMVRYAQVDLAWIVIKLVVTLAWAVPAEQAMMSRIIQAFPPPTTAPGGAATTGPTTNPAPASTGSSEQTTEEGHAVVVRPVAMTWSAPVPAAAFVTTGVSPFFDDENWPIYQAVLLALGSIIYPLVVLRYMTRRRVREAFEGVTHGPPPA